MERTMTKQDNAKKTTANDFGFAFDPQNFFKGFDLKGAGFETIFQTAQKNIETSSQICQLSFDCMVQLANAQSAYIQSMTEKAHTANQDLLSGKADPKENLEKSAEAARKAYEECVENIQKASKLIEKTNADVAALITKRTNEAFDEIKKAA